MPALQLNKIFLGHTPVEQRKYITEVFKFLKDKYPKLIIPAVGAFTLAKCAISAGYARENISTSDISLYSSLLGYLFSGKPIDSLNFKIVEAYKWDYEELSDDTDKVAYLLWLMKVAQMSKIHYVKLMYEDLIENKKRHINHLKNQVIEMRDFFTGINYELKDLRAEFIKREDDTLLVVNPPVFKKGYTKMFDFKGFIEFENGIEEFDWKKEYVQLYENTKLLNYPVIWYRFRSVDGFNDDEVIFAKEYEVEKQDYWLITKPEVLKTFPYYKNIASFKRKNLRPYHLPLFSGKDRISENSVIRFVTVPVEVGLYYRDLFAHKLGNTGKEFGEVIHRTASNKNRIYKLNGIRTTCLSKYRSIKTHQSILTRLSRELLPSGMYKISAGCAWHDRDFKETLRIFLEENRTGQKIIKEIPTL